MQEHLGCDFLDFAGPVPVTASDAVYIIVVVCKYIEAAAVKDATAKGATEFLQELP